MRRQVASASVAIDYNVIRGLAYYTGVVFEAFDRKGEFRAIAGGGRYDQLVKLLSQGKVDLPALGFGMGDVVSLVERAAETIQQDEAEAMAAKMAKGQFDMNDLRAQLQQMQRMGGLGALVDRGAFVGRQTSGELIDGLGHRGGRFSRGDHP